jgi:uncharacterized protein YerC
MKKKIDQLTDTQRIETLDILYTAAGAITGRDATKAFLKELLTPSERIMLGRRIWIARLLLTGHTHAEIGEQLEVGPNTIVRVEKWLQKQMPGYRVAIKGLELELEKRKAKYDGDYKPFTFKALRKKYPMHFLLFPGSK